jgi:hypothetical protein
LLAKLQEQSFPNYCIVKMLQIMSYIRPFNYQNGRKSLKKIQPNEVREQFFDEYLTQGNEFEEIYRFRDI